MATKLNHKWLRRKGTGVWHVFRRVLDDMGPLCGAYSTKGGRFTVTPWLGHPRELCPQCENLEAGFPAEGSKDGYLEAMRLGLGKAKRHENLWLWNIVEKEVFAACDSFQAFYKTKKLELWLPAASGGENSIRLTDTFSTGNDHVFDARLAYLYTPQHVPTFDRPLVDRGRLFTDDGLLDIRFDDAPSFKRALCLLFALGSTGRWLALGLRTVREHEKKRQRKDRP